MNDGIIFSHRRDIALSIGKSMHDLKAENCVLFLKISEGISPEEGFPGGSDNKESACDSGDLALIPGSRRSPGEGNGNPLQDSCLENSMDRGVWWATVYGVAKSQT